MNIEELNNLAKKATVGNEKWFYTKPNVSKDGRDSTIMCEHFAIANGLKPKDAAFIVTLVNNWPDIYKERAELERKAKAGEELAEEVEEWEFIAINMGFLDPTEPTERLALAALNNTVDNYKRKLK